MISPEREKRDSWGTHKQLKFRKLCPTRPEGAEALSPGQRPGLFGAVTCRPVRAKALKLLAIFKAFALTGRVFKIRIKI